MTGGYDRNTSSVDPRVRPWACPYCHAVHGSSSCDALISQAEFERRIGMPFLDYVQYLIVQKQRELEVPEEEEPDEQW